MRKRPKRVKLGVAPPHDLLQRSYRDLHDVDGSAEHGVNLKTHDIGSKELLAIAPAPLLRRKAVCTEDGRRGERGERVSLNPVPERHSFLQPTRGQQSEP